MMSDLTLLKNTQTDLTDCLEIIKRKDLTIEEQEQVERLVNICRLVMEHHKTKTNYY